MNFINAKGHIVIDLNGNYYVVDTGAPGSFNFNRTRENITLEGRSFPLGVNTFGATPDAELEKLVGKKLYGFIGMDILKQTNCTIDYNNNTITFNVDSSCDNLNSVDIKFGNGMSILLKNGLKIDDKDVSDLVIDTGAIISYLPKHLLINAKKLEEKYYDFNPIIKVMNDYYYEVAINIGGLTSKKKVGNVDNYPMLKTMLMQYPAIGVVGLDFISNKGYFIFDFKNNKLLFK